MNQHIHPSNPTIRPSIPFKRRKQPNHDPNPSNLTRKNLCGQPVLKKKHSVLRLHIGQKPSPLRRWNVAKKQIVVGTTSREGNKWHRMISKRAVWYSLVFFLCSCSRDSFSDLSINLVHLNHVLQFHTMLGDQLILRYSQDGYTGASHVSLPHCIDMHRSSLKAWISPCHVILAQLIVKAPKWHLFWHPKDPQARDARILV